MSVQATTWAWQQNTESSGQRLVLLALADAAGGDEDDPRMCWPSVARISAMVGIGESTVKMHMERLAEIGLISKIERRRRRDGTLGTWWITVNFTRADPSAVVTPTRADPPAVAEPTTADPSAVDHSRPIGSLEPSFSEPPKEISRAFDVFWAAYPRRIAKPAAKRAWMNISKRDQAVALQAIDAWCKYWTAKGEPEFIPYPQKWLNQRYFDAAPPALPRAKNGVGLNGMGLPPEMVAALRDTTLPSRDELRARRDEPEQKELTP